ncbi:PstS family phosphate ABC transporter substrate-binding protein [Pseudobacteriovorax antillogorgiicola]|uniref:Phosphate-binding protein n=1 Tax=Pseudobacteriovorax antillogorgiicola TaxID=1513793 RepID=A0A1Y6CNX5_9BACT|nr:PstS family phosphate ABC transporter substrate-binding protein [Pseudobacteriovorax antillogorgiicola]TCS44410.1 phosphate ABC transporter substrate-binding protein (PhoT family) [Pseudobacteriovorax antillogorgiicola]SMF79198.1 phosphate ABC transporter substrate-binding protein, PhoT family [Pseudobacteriovorax antillogorgiicola]
MKLSHLSLGMFLTMSFASPAISAGKLKGTVKLDGSSTVFPVAEAVAEEFQKVQPRVRVTVGLSGTGGGFKKFTSGETDISNASREIAEKEEKLAEKNHVKYIEIPVAFDGVSVVLHPKNEFAKNLTMSELKKIWEPNSKVKTWKDVRSTFPNEPIKLYGPGADSGTFDFFTEAVMGKSRRSRSDYVSSEDDNVLVRGVSADLYSMGYFGYAYYQANESKLGLVSVADKGDNYVTPTPQTIESGKYVLARPLLIYVSLKAAQREEVAKFVEFFIENAASLSKEVGYVPLPKKTYEKALADFRKAVKSSQSH